MAYISFQPTDYFSTKLFTGNGSTQSITGVGFQPDMNFVKSRAVQNWGCVDAVRGVGEAIHPNLTLAEGSAPDGLTAFNADGFSVGTDTTWNGSTVAYASYNWKAGTTTGIAGSPSITPSSYSFNATSGYSIIAYTGTTTGGETIPHGLGVVPNMVIVKKLSATSNWLMYHSAVDATAPEDYSLSLNANTVRDDSVGGWHDTAPTSTLVSLGVDNNTGSATYVAYCFADVPGYSKFGTYIGNGNADGTFIYTGFRPAFFMLKSATAVENWYTMDNKRDGYNEKNDFLNPDETAAEIVKTNNLMSNGVKLGTADGSTNGSGQTFIYAAFAEFPIVSSNDVPTVAR